MRRSNIINSLTTNASLKLVSFLIAIVLWFVVLGSRNVEVTKEVPLELITPSDLVVSNDVPDRVAFRLSGPKAFLRNILNRKEPPIRVNLSSAKAGVVTYRFFSDNIPIPIGVKVVLINPTAIVVKLENSKIKEVPVRLVTMGEASAGYRISHLELMRMNIKVKGAESRIDSINEIPTTPLDLSRIKESGEREISLDKIKMEGISLEGELPKVHFDVTQENANFKIRNASIRVLTDRRFKVQPPEVSLYVRCNSEDLKNLDRTKVYATADVKGKGPGVYEIQLSAQVPTTMKLVRISPAKIKVTLY